MAYRLQWSHIHVPCGGSLPPFRHQSTNLVLLRIGLIPSPRRTEAGYRLFSQQDVERLAFIVRAKSLGLSLDEIKDILALKDERSLTCRAVHDRLNRKMQEIENTIQQLQLLHDELMPLVQQCSEHLQTPDKECVVLDPMGDIHPG